MGTRRLLVYGAGCSLFALTMAINAQQQKRVAPLTTPRAAASVSGRVFGITEGGDIKPARFAHVYLFYVWSGRPASQQTQEDKSADTAGASFMDRYSAALQRMLDELKNSNMPRDEDLFCTRELLAVHEAVVATLGWVQENGKSKQFVSVDTDEEGLFRMTNVPAGRYILMARGRAGANDAFWKSELLVQAGSDVSVKLSSPETSCPSIP